MNFSVEVRRGLEKLAKKSDNLFHEDNLNILEQKLDSNEILDQKEEGNFKKLVEQIPDGIYISINEIKNLIAAKRKRNFHDSISFSPLTIAFKEFQCCKIMKYSKGHIITGRDLEIESILLTLCKESKRGVILIGEPGTGKTSIVNAINARLIQRTVPRQLIGAQIFNMDIPSILTKYQNPMDTIIKVLERASEYDKAILFIDEIHQLLGQRLNDVLKPYLTEQIRFIGSTTIDEYQSIITDDRALERRFTQIYISEPNIERTVEMIKGTKSVIEDHHKCLIPDSICEYAVKTGSRFLGHRKNPDKSLDILDIACSIMSDKELKVNYTKSKKGNNILNNVLSIEEEFKSIKTIAGDRLLTEHYIDLAISSLTGINFGEIKNSLDFNSVSSRLKNKICGQDTQMETLANIVNIYKVTSSERTRPISVLLMVGPSGTGKRESSLELTKCLFGKENNFIEQDMSGFGDSFRISELRGAPPGYVGYGKSGSLIKKIRNNSQSIIFFKNIEKTHEDIRQYLLDSCKTGKMVDSAEREAYLNNSIVIFSVTLGKDDLKAVLDSKTKVMGFQSDSSSESNDTFNKKALEKIVGVDLLKCVDDVIIFNKLTKENLGQIFDNNINDFTKIYNVKIDLQTLKESIINSCENGHEVLSQLTSEVPRLVFNHLKKGNNNEITIPKEDSVNDPKPSAKRKKSKSNSN